MNYQGECAGCSAAVPVGLLARVTKWKSIERGQVFNGEVVSHQSRTMVPEELFCRTCPASGPRTKAKVTAVRTVAAKVVTELPYKAGSFKRKVLEAAINGLNLYQLQKMAEEAGRDVNKVKAKIMSGRGRTHKWRPAIHDGVITVSGIAPLTV